MLSGLEVVEVGAGDSYAVALDSQGAFSSENWATDLSCLPSVAPAQGAHMQEWWQRRVNGSCSEVQDQCATHGTRTAHAR